MTGAEDNVVGSSRSVDASVRRPGRDDVVAAARRVVATSAPADAFSVAVLSRTGQEDAARLSTGNDVALGELGAGDADAAVDRLTGEVAACVAGLGSAHPDTLVVRGNLAMARLAAGQVRQAVLEARAVLEDRGTVLGADHPSTLNARLALAVAHLTDDDAHAAVAVLDTASAVLRLPRHPSSRSTRSAARLCDQLTAIARAELGSGAPLPVPGARPAWPASPRPAPSGLI